MRHILALAGVAALALSALSSAASAHHSFAMFDSTKRTNYVGVVKTLEWTNPHVWMELVARDGGATKTFGFEGGAIAVLKRYGWSKDTVKVGDTITMTAHPYRNGRPGGSIEFVTLADGRKVGGGDGIPGAVVVGAGK